jgi:hypothetical protein
VAEKTEHVKITINSFRTASSATYVGLAFFVDTCMAMEICEGEENILKTIQ